MYIYANTKIIGGRWGVATRGEMRVDLGLGLELSQNETDAADVVPAHDFLIALPKFNSKGVRVTIH